MASEQNLLHFQLALVEARQSQLRAEHFAVRINTGAYKSRLGRVTNGARVPYTEQQILDDEVATMHRHIQLAEEHLEFAKTHLSVIKRSI